MVEASREWENGSHEAGYEMKGHPNQTADNCPIDTDELQIPAYRVFYPSGYRGRVPPFNGFRNKPNNLRTVSCGDPYDGATSKAVNLKLEALVMFQRCAYLGQTAAHFVAKFALRIACAAN